MGLEVASASSLLLILLPCTASLLYLRLFNALLNLVTQTCQALLLVTQSLTLCSRFLSTKGQILSARKFTPSGDGFSSKPRKCVVVLDIN